MTPQKTKMAEEYAAKGMVGDWSMYGSFIAGWDSLEKTLAEVGIDGRRWLLSGAYIGTPVGSEMQESRIAVSKLKNATFTGDHIETIEALPALALIEKLRAEVDRLERELHNKGLDYENRCDLSNLYLGQRNAARDRADRLESENATLKSRVRELEGYKIGWDNQRTYIETLKEENQRLREALKFYADEHNHNYDGHGLTAEHGNFEFSIIQVDEGKTAREALGGGNE